MAQRSNNTQGLGFTPLTLTVSIEEFKIIFGRNPAAPAELFLATTILGPRTYNSMGFPHAPINTMTACGPVHTAYPYGQEGPWHKTVAPIAAETNPTQVPAAAKRTFMPAPNDDANQPAAKKPSMSKKQIVSTSNNAVSGPLSEDTVDARAQAQNATMEWQRRLEQMRSESRAKLIARGAPFRRGNTVVRSVPSGK